MIYGPTKSGPSYKYDYAAMKASYQPVKPTTTTTTPTTGSNTSYVNNDAIKSVTDVRAGAAAMKSALVDAAKNSTFNGTQAVSSNTDSVAFSPLSNPTANFAQTKLGVSQVATANVNQGTALKADDLFSGTKGIQQFEVEHENQKYTFTIDVKQGDTNKAVQQKMAEAINSKKLGFTADVSQDTAAKTSSLSIKSVNTGADNGNSFAVKDLLGTLVSTTGTGTRTQAAQDSIYKVNGEQKTSKSNDVILGNGVIATLKKATTNDVTISVQKDTKSQTDAVKKLVEGYNSFLSSAKGSSKLTNELNSVYKTYASSLNKLGISAKSDGSLSIDSTALNKSAEDGSVGRFFNQSNTGSYGFTGRLDKIASTANSNPTSYVATNATKPGQSGYNYPYNYTSASSTANIAGSLFNMYA